MNAGVTVSVPSSQNEGRDIIQHSTQSLPPRHRSSQEPARHKRKLFIIGTKRSHDELPTAIYVTPPTHSSSSPGGSAGESDDRSNNHVTARRTETNRKAAARRNLIGSICTKHSGIKRSFAFVAAGPPHVRLPRVGGDVTIHGKSADITNIEKCKSPLLNKYNSNQSTRINASLLGDTITTTQCHRGTTGLSRAIHRTCSQKLSLPEIITDFNVDTNMAANMSTGHWAHTSVSSADASYEDRTLGAPYEDYLKRPKYTANNPCRTKYRPVTPGLLETLGKLKLPSKVKTEQWVRSNQGERKDYCIGPYRVGPADAAKRNSCHPGWIYTDT